MVDRLVNSDANRERIETVEKCFGTSGIRLLKPGRVLVGEGILTKICRKKPKKRQFYLFNDIMVYGNILINKKKYTRQHIIPLEGVIIEDLCEVDKYGWLIKAPTKSFAVYASSDSEKKEWIVHINKCIDELLRRTGKTAPNASAAVWVPDTETTRCMHCKQTQFTLINRRHHCRNCGLVICGNCSKNKSMIPLQSSKPVRVCDSCFNDLCERRVSINDHSKHTPATTVTVVNESSSHEDSAKLTAASTAAAATATTAAVAAAINGSQSAENHSHVKNTSNNSESSGSISEGNLVDVSSEERNVATDVVKSDENNGNSVADVKSEKVVSHFAPISDEPSAYRKQDSETQETDDDSDDDETENSQLNDALNSLDICTAPVFYDNDVTNNETGSVATKPVETDAMNSSPSSTSPQDAKIEQQVPENQTVSRDEGHE